MIKLKDGTEWPDNDYHAQRAKELGCTRSEAKSWLMIQNYSEGTRPLNQVNWKQGKLSISQCHQAMVDLARENGYVATVKLEVRDIG